MLKLTPDRDIVCRKVKIPRSDGNPLSALVLSPGTAEKSGVGILWIHGGGYVTGMKEMVHMSRAVDLVKKYGAVVISPGYRLSLFHPYPAAVNDCYDALLFLRDSAELLGIDPGRLMIGGESAGGGLCAAVCMMARDRKEVNIAFQMPLYPMLDSFDTDSSRDNRGKVWNTRRNRLAWKLYLRKDYGKIVSPYASPSRQTDFRDLPPCYTFVGTGEPFFCETVEYVRKLREAGLYAEMDVYDTDMHAFDMLRPGDPLSREAADNFNRHFVYAMEHFAAGDPDQ